MNKKNLVSCLCVSGNSYQLLNRAIKCFLSQTYKHKELIIVYQNNCSIDKNIIEQYRHEDIIFFEEDPNLKLTLGDLRNKSIAISNGEYVCIWDDDDWYHNQRLEMQVKALKRNYKPACLLTNQLLFDETNSETYYTNTRMWENSLLCKKSLFNEDLNYQSADIDEDSPLLNKFINNDYVYPLIGPTLYIYVYHGKNTWQGLHFQTIMSMSQKLSNQFSHLVQKILSGQVSNDEGSKKLVSPNFLREINYLHSSYPLKHILHLHKEQDEF